jgi:DNA-binding HxlR family transcriptional regulator
MAYRGDDLDLRTPGSRGVRDVGARESYRNDVSGGGANGIATGTRGRNGALNRAEPTVVDETVLACCNHAYDIALAHGASEVRLEHLVHALTRVEAAAEILEERGIREAHLRRESAAVIASEIPVGLAHSHSAPRSSIELEDVLRRASDMAGANAAGASVHDLLWVLLNYDRNIPAIALLLRHATDWQKWDWPHRRLEPRRDDARRDDVRRDEMRRDDTRRDDMRRDELRREEIRREPAPRLDAAYYAERRAAYVEPARTRSEPVYSDAPRARVDVGYASADNDAVMLRLDQMDLSIRTLQADAAADRRALTDLLRELQRDVMSTRNDGPAIPTGLFDRLTDVERTVELRLEDLSRTAEVLTDRLHGVEKAVTSGMSEGARNWAAMGDRLKTIDKGLSQTGGANLAGLGDLVTEQLVTVTDKLVGIEADMEARDSQNQRIMSALVDRLKAIEEGAGQANGGTMQTLLNERFQALRQVFDQQRTDLTGAVAAQSQPVMERMRQLETALDRRHGEGAQIWKTTSDRMAQVEGFLKLQDERTVAVAKAHERDLTEVHDALLKLGTNQQTLSENLDQWRCETGGDLSIISNRLELLERSTAKPLDMLQQMQASMQTLQTDVQGLQQVAIADYDHGRRGFKTWLFGTDEVFAHSWRDETQQVRERLQQIRAQRKG